MSSLEKYHGVFPAFYACYDEKGDINPEAVEKLAKHYLDAGVKGLYVGGSSGECIYQTIEERKLVLEHVMKAVGGKMTIIAHVAATSTRQSVELAKHAESVGADALSAIPPIYFVLSEDAIYEYWQAMIDATSLDFIIYNIPQTTQYALSQNLYKRMLEDDKVIGVKNSSMPVQDIYLMKAGAKELGKEVVVFNGPDEQFISGRVMGADSGIGGTYGVMPELFLAADEAIRSNDIELARAIQHDIDEIIFTLTSGRANMYAVIKAILERENPELKLGGVRAPLLNVTDVDLPVIEKSEALLKAAREKYVK